MATYTVKQLARLSGVSVRTLHHSDEIGLLKPAFTGENRYRYYGREELLRLQDILFHRELGVPLADIARLLAGQDRDRLAILAEHREMLADRVKRFRQLLQTIDRTIAELNGERAMDDKELYKGFAPGKQAEYEDWLVENYGDTMRQGIDASKAHWTGKSEDAMRAALAKGEEAEVELAERFHAGIAPDALELEPMFDRHRHWVSGMWGRECAREGYGRMADIYIAHPDFRTHFDKRGTGFTDWLTAAMKAYAARPGA
jgi:DNA-binding transcriptional MerR regulator